MWIEVCNKFARSKIGIKLFVASQSQHMTTGVRSGTGPKRTVNTRLRQTKMESQQVMEFLLKELRAKMNAMQEKADADMKAWQEETAAGTEAI